MRVIIAGGTGLIGSALATSLLADKDDVIILTRNPEKHAVNFPDEIHLAKWDGDNPSDWIEFLEGCDALVNLAGEGIADARWSEARKQAIIDSRVTVGKALLAAIDQTTDKPKVLIQSSAVGYYGARGDTIITEDTPPGNDFQARVCVEWENSTKALEETGIRRVIIRTGVVLDNRGGAFPKLLMPVRFFIGGPIGSGKQWFPWIHIDDEIAGIRFLIGHSEAEGAYNLCSPNPLQNKEFIKVLGKVIGRPGSFPTPSSGIRFLFGEMADVLFNSYRQLPNRLLEAGFEFKFPKAEEALTNILR